VGLYSAAYKTLLLEAMRSGASVPAITHVQLHTGSPGASGTANIATGSGATRQAVSWAAESGGIIVASTSVVWSVVAGTYTHVSFWTALTGGTFCASDDFPSPMVYGGSGSLPLASLALDLNAAASAA
jgi:hypothetical protein